MTKIIYVKEAFAKYWQMLEKEAQAENVSLSFKINQVLKNYYEEAKK